MTDSPTFWFAMLFLTLWGFFSLLLWAFG